MLKNKIVYDAWSITLEASYKDIFFKIFNYFESSWLKPIFNECSDVATTMMHESIVLQFSIE